MHSVTVIIPHWKDKEDTLLRIENAKALSIPANILILNWGKDVFAGEETTTKTLAEVVLGLSTDYVQFITPGATIHPNKIQDCFEAACRPFYLDSQLQGDSLVLIKCGSNLEVFEQIATGACPLTLDAALISRHLLVKVVTQSPEGLTRMGRRLLGGTDRWLIIDTLVHEKWPICSERISSTTLTTKSTGLAFNPFAHRIIKDLLTEHRSILQERQADGFNAIVKNSPWGWEAMTFLQSQVWGRALLINCPSWLPNTLINSSGCDTFSGVESLPRHYEYYPEHFQCLITDDPERDIGVWGSTLKFGATVATWVEQGGDYSQSGGIWFRAFPIT